jgi:peptide/nickel transport system permease protein
MCDGIEVFEQQATELVVSATGPAPAEARGLAKRFWDDGSVRLGGSIIVIVAAAAFAAPFVAHLLGHGPTDQFRDTALADDGTPVGPSRSFLLGADGDGRDVLVRVLYGTRISLLIGIPATTIAMVVGTALGLLAGFSGGRTDRVISQAVDIALSFPFIVTSLSLLVLNRHADGSPILSPAVVVVLIIALFSWTYFARLVRGLAGVLRHLPFVEAAEVSGAGWGRLLWKELGGTTATQYRCRSNPIFSGRRNPGAAAKPRQYDRRR